MTRTNRHELDTHMNLMIYGIYMLCSALFRNLRFLQKALHFLGIPRKRSADLNVHTHTRLMWSSPSPSPGRRCHFYHGTLGQLDTVRARTVSDAPRCGSEQCRTPHGAGPNSVGLPCAVCPMVRFLQKVRYSIEWHAF